MKTTIFYSHPICRYGTAHERNAIRHIRERFPTAEIINPSDIEFCHDENIDQRMRRCLQISARADVLIYERLLTRITAGVAKEVNQALAMRKPVYELLDDGRMFMCTKPVLGLSVQQTRALYRQCTAA
jgi:hypothetical protein